MVDGKKAIDPTLGIHTGQDQRMGSIGQGQARRLLSDPGDPTKDLKAIKTISMVVKDGVFYYPTEAFSKFGIKPFTTAPRVTLPR